MRVRARLILFGALLPSAGTLVAALAAGQLFAHDLLRSVDEGLRNQAAVESVSVFDAPGGAPHLHPRESPLPEQPMLPNVTLAVYGADGDPVIRFPETAEIPPRLAPAEGHANPGPRTVLTATGERRELVVNLVSRRGERYALWLATSLDRLHSTMSVFYRATLSVCAVVALLLFSVQGWQARKLSSRIVAVSAHLPRLREGDFDSAPPPDDTEDEVADLREAVVEVTAELKAARERQDRLIANAAHELRTPLGLMRTEIDLALRRERTPEELRSALQESRREVDRLAGLAQRLLELAALRGAMLPHQSEDLVAIVNDAVVAHRAEAGERGVSLVVATPPRAEASVAATRIRQAVDNLVANALRFAPVASVVDVNITEAAGRWRITVIDRGPGVPKAERERIFEPFFRGRGANPAAGAGLGLAIVREVAREHGGATWLDGGTDSTTFVLEIDAAESNGDAES